MINEDGKSVVDFKDFNQICRICLNKDDIESIYNKTSIDNDLINIIDLLEYCVLLKVQNDDCLPQNLCRNCINELYQIFRFKKKCQDNQTLLILIRDDATNAINFTNNDTTTNDDDYNNYCESVANDNDDDNTIAKDDDKPSSILLRRQLTNRRNTKMPQYRSKIIRSRKRKTKKQQHAQPEPRNHCCEFCSKMFTSSKLRQHIRSHTKEKPYKCTVCPQAFSMGGNLKRHIMTHTGERPHVCQTCGKGFIQATSLHTHEKTHNDRYFKIDPISNNEQPYRFTCEYCGRGFKRSAAFNAHITRYHSSESSSLVLINNIVRTPMEQPQQQESIDIIKHECTICGKWYKNKHLLKAHKLTHGEKKFLCSDCGKNFITKAALVSHLKIHTGEKPYTCRICTKSFAHMSSFDSHMLIHTGQRPYCCSFCTKTFTQLSHLTYHLRTHSGERPFACSYCGKTFALKGNLTVHVRTHTGETPYLCTVCGKGFYDSSSMKKHRRNHKNDEHKLVVVPSGLIDKDGRIVKADLPPPTQLQQQQQQEDKFPISVFNSIM